MEIKFNNVNYKYNNSPNQVLTDINVSFSEGKIHGIAGCSGSGKSTMSQLINALLLPDTGYIKVGSRVLNKTKIISDVNNLRYQIGLVFQFPEDQFFCSTVLKEVEFGIKYFKKNTSNILKHVKDSLLMVGLDDTYLDRDPFSLSSGEMRKVAIASVLAFNPKVIILDEPTICLDEKSKSNIIKIIKMLKMRYNKTIIVVSQDTDLLHQLCDHIVLLYKGKVVLDGNKYEVFTQDIEKYGLKKPKIIEFEQLVLKEKGIKLGYRDDINDLMKDIYRHVK